MTFDGAITKGRFLLCGSGFLERLVYHGAIKSLVCEAAVSGQRIRVFGAYLHVSLWVVTVRWDDTTSVSIVWIISFLLTFRCMRIYTPRGGAMGDLSNFLNVFGCRVASLLERWSFLQYTPRFRGQ